MKKTELNKIGDPVDLQILSNIDGKKNITDISRETGYTYKSVFHRIKRLEKQKFVILEKTKDITEGAILTIPPEVKEKIAHEIRRYKFAESDIEEFKKDKELSKNIVELLNFIEKNRLVSDQDISSFIWEKYYISGKPERLTKIFTAYKSLISSGILRSRLELTRAGRKFLLNSSNQKPKRKDFNPMELAEGLSRRKELYEALHPETKHNATFKGNQFEDSPKTKSDIDRFTQDKA